VEELVADTTLIAARILHNAETKGKKVAAASAAYYAIQHCRSGRRSVGNSCCDVHGSATRLCGRSKLTSLDEVVGSDESGEPLTLHDVLSTGGEDPGTKAARKMDWQGFCAALPGRERSIVSLMVQGKRFTSIASKLRVSVSTVHTARQQLASKILDFMGADILVEVRRKPRWMDSLNATRARLAVRDERRTL
jgi:DNA-directed RNA polymerase specialized sigma24 family protein